MTSKSGIWPSLIESTAGNTLPMAAAAMLLSAGLIGGGVDISRAYLAHNRLQAACDAGVLAGRKAVKTGGYDETAEKAADTYFAANFDQTNEGSTNTVFSSESDDNGNTIVGTATTDLGTTVMTIFGMDEFNLSVTCTSSLGVGNSDIIMVLDTTGSMDWTADSNKAPTSNQTSRLQDLQAAMKNFFTTVAEATSDSNARIRYGFVPYSSSVNVGKLIRAANPDYMAENYTVQTRSWYKWGDANDTGTGSAYTAETLTSWNEGTRAYSKSSSCQSDIPTSSSWSDSGSPTNPGTTTWTIDAQGNRQNTTITKQQKQVKPQYECRKSGRNYYIYTQNVERFSQTFAYSEQKPVFITSPTETYNGLMYHEGTYNVSEYLKGNTVSTLTGTSNGAPALVSSTWGGCIEERKTKAESSFSYTVGEGITPTGALDLDIDSAPTADIASKWKPMWPEVAFNRGTDGPTTTGRAVTSACPAAAQLLTEMTEEDFDKYANSLTADGATYHDIGLIWGARLSSPTGIWKTNVNEEPDNGGAVSRHLIFMTDGALAPSNTNQSSYGIESRDKRVTGNGTSTLELTSRHRSRFLAVCEAIKGKGIRLWVISFATTLSEDLQTCASSNSSYSATDAKQLNDAFQKIAKQVGELRVTQ